MTLREIQEMREHEDLCPYAAFSDQSLGRDVEIAECDIRPIYQRDRDKILHSKAFRRLNAKTQVFLSPNGDHYRTRLTHTLEVSNTARTIARALKLNEDLTEAIALGHDLGHTPFGHAGERALAEVMPGGFKHADQSVRVVEVLEKDGKGLNLTKEVRDGIKCHGVEGKAITLEGRIVRLSDKFAYTAHDIDDAIRGKLIREEDLPKEFTDVLGHKLSERLNTLIHDVVTNTQRRLEDSAFTEKDIIMSREVEEAFKGLRNFMFANIYCKDSVAKTQEDKAEKMVKYLFIYYSVHTEELPEEYIAVAMKEGQERAACDYVAGMTDRYATMKFRELTIPEAWDIF